MCHKSVTHPPYFYDSSTFFTNQSPTVRCSASALCFNKKR
nr:MAG TPA: hypothetical protein [Siphoviridae sp. ctgbm9]